jgi:hypothetical protein
MTYPTPRPRVVLSPDRPDRRVLLALEVVDPIGQRLVTRGLEVSAVGLARPPIVSVSGRFVWLEEGELWPTEISVTPVGLPFAAEVVVPARPPRFPVATPSERLVRVVLRPSAAYDVPSGITAVRGQLSERLDGPDMAAIPVQGARMQLAHFDSASDTWIPQPPATRLDPATDRRGEFLAFLRRQPRRPPDLDVVKGLIRVRLQVTMEGPIPETRVTPDDFPFLEDPAPKGRVVEGQLLSRDLKLGWADLRPI